ncbi:MAG: PilZ domain-containing protein [Myxococcaceae bacterium]|nr:PilZ domain-containing protein [Myxococcaceae bacterium]
MAAPSFAVVFIWESSASPGAAATFIEQLKDTVPAEKVTLSVALRPTSAALNMQLDFSLYSRAMLATLERAATAAQGRFVELMRVAAEQRDKFKQQFMVGVDGAAVDMRTYEGAAKMIKDHLGGTVVGVPRPSPSPAPDPSPVARAPAPSRPPPPSRPVEAPRAPPVLKPTDGPSRRADQRFDAELQVAFGTEADFRREYSANISKGGLFLKTSARPALNSETTLAITLPNGQTLTTSARVVHVQDHPQYGGLGLAFGKGSAAFEAGLKAYLSALGAG